MVNIELLENTIKNRGIKKTHIANRIGVTYVTFTKKMRKQSPFTIEDAAAIQHALNLTDVERDNIFFG